MNDSASMCPEFEQHIAAPHAPVTGCKRPPPACTQETDTAFMSDSGDESVTSSCGSSASFGSVSRSFSFSAPTNSPSSDEGTSKQASASSLVSPILLQSQGFQEGWLRELEAMGVPTTDNLDEALQSEGRLAYMPRKKRPTPSASSVAFLSSPHAETSLQVRKLCQTPMSRQVPQAPSPDHMSVYDVHACLLCRALRWHVVHLQGMLRWRGHQTSSSHLIASRVSTLRVGMIWTCMQAVRALACMQGGSSHDTGFTSMQPAASLRLPAPVFSQMLPAQIRSPLFGCDCPICTGIAVARPAAGAGDKLLQVCLANPAFQGALLYRPSTYCLMRIDTPPCCCTS